MIYMSLPQIIFLSINNQYEPVFKNSAEYVEFMEQFDSKEIFE